MSYTETTEKYNGLSELNSDLNRIMKRIWNIGARKLDVEIKVDLMDFTITITAPEGVNIAD